MEEQIVNRISASNLVTFDLEELYTPGLRISFDIKDILFQGLVLKEKDIRDFIKNHNWPDYQNKYVAITCTADAIVPTWAFMLISIALQPYATTVIYGSLEDLEQVLFKKKLDIIDWEKYRNAKIVVKGCSKVQVPVAIYVETVNRLRPVASSIMYGEACSTVPLLKKKK